MVRSSAEIQAQSGAPGSREPSSTLRILLVAYRFPPQVGGGVHRPLRLAKYWNREGHRVGVLTVPVDPHAVQDPSLLAKVPDAVEITRVGDPSLPAALERIRGRLSGRRAGAVVARALGYVQHAAQTVSIPDRHIGWLLPAFTRGLPMARRFDPDVVVATGPPWTPFLVGRWLASALGTPLVLDYRDAWTGLFVEGTQTRLQRWLDPSVERWVLDGAAGVVAAHRSIFRDLPHPVRRGRARARRLWSPNGYDPEDFGDRVAPEAHRFVLSYSGAVGGHRNPRVFFEVLERLLDSGRMDPERVRLRMAGGLPIRLRAFLSALPRVSSVLEDVGYLQHTESARLLLSSTVNLVFVRDVDARNLHSPGKVYEVFHVGRPTLVLSPEGVTTRLARRVGECRVAHPTDPGGIEAGLLDLYDRWSRGEPLPHPDPDRLRFYSREHQARRFLRLLVELASGSPATARATAQSAPAVLTGSCPPSR